MIHNNKHRTHTLKQEIGGGMLGRRKFLKIAGYTTAAVIFNPLSFLRKPNLVEVTPDTEFVVGFYVPNGVNKRSREFKDKYLVPAKTALKERMKFEKERRGLLQVGRIRCVKKHDSGLNDMNYSFYVTMGKPVYA